MKSSVAFLLFYCILPIVSPSFLHGQADSALVSRCIENLKKQWSLLPPPTPVAKQSNSMFDAQRLFRFNGVASTQATFKQENYNQARADYLRKDWGLSLSGSYLENFNTAPNDEDNLIYQRRVQAGVSWDILRSGYLENRYKAKSLEIDNELARMFPYERSRDVAFTQRWNLTLFLFNLHKIALLNERELLVKHLLTQEQALFHQKYITYEHLLTCETRYAEILSLKLIYEKFNERLAQSYALGADTLTDWQLPLLEADYVYLTQGSLPAYMDSAYRNIDEKLQLDYAFINEISLSPFVRYNYYDVANGPSNNRSFVSAGVNVGVPLTFRKKEKEELIKLEGEKTREQLIFREENGSKELLTEYYEYEYKLKQYVSFHQKRLRFIELLRQETARYKIDPVNFNPVKALELYDDVLSIENEMLDLKQNMYLKLLRIAERKGDQKVENYCRIIELPDHLENYFREEKSVYVWSKSYETGNPLFLSEYIRFQQFGRAALSVGYFNETRKDAFALARELKKNGIATEVLVGSNKITPENIVSVLEKAVAGSDSLFVGVHLDYEPHTFGDWDQRKAEYLRDYQKILALASDFCKKRGLELRISIPTHYPVESVQSFLPYCDGIVFMAYENIKMGHLLNKLSPYTDQGQKVFIALRTEDFKSRTELESFLQEFSATSGFTQFYVHDVARCMQWDANTVGGDE
ncbi:MAG: hypothetical protein ACHQF2_05000 [Flavobacteriales bacterium]